MPEVKAEEMTVERTGHVHRATVKQLWLTMLFDPGIFLSWVFFARETPRLSSIPRGVHQPRITLQNLETVARRAVINGVRPFAKHCRAASARTV